MKGLEQNEKILHPGIEYAKIGYFRDKHTGKYGIYELGFSLKL
ncbi:hypothetical protein LEP1GSC193_4032 [Leptospira alstonii serovar Pingchang str. 80-412]|uniref:Uncharacterized protein n=2 Tax=Leptospira alstonii TaxID=28452 RepID=M6CKV1_9LEPT|nr:hypothetical protein LEP1GSC194_4061 [Leptospira alstonii serovar Sichuan str. 79601]EQA80505.1 hypothetical protein LEP1GSC193_4032 [Leptospira alstonii serovar Pingchang str. 80-412]